MAEPPAPDPRLTPARPDLAARSLAGKVVADRYADPVRRRVRLASVPLRRAPEPTRGYETELLFGEAFDLYEERDGWAWGQAVADGYVGYLPAGALAPEGPAPTHRVAALRTFLYPGPGIKTTPLGFLPHGAQVIVEGQEGDFARLAEGFVYAGHLVPSEFRVADPVAEAERFLGIPYLWGGRTSLGIDCSGLVQTVCRAAGIAAPRDSDMQEAGLGAALALPNDAEGFRRGDLLFWPGHVALAEGEGRMIHATAYGMSVISEPIAGALARIEAQGTPLRSVRRLPRLP